MTGTFDLPDTYDGWQLDRSQTDLTTSTPRFVYVTRHEGHRYSILVELDGCTFDGALLDNIEPINHHRSPIQSFYGAKTIEEAFDNATDWMDTGLDPYLDEFETDFEDTDSYPK